MKLQHHLYQKPELIPSTCQPNSLCEIWGFHGENSSLGLPCYDAV